MVETLWQDIRFATRSLTRTPTFTAAAIVTLALGIGANTAIFSLVEAVLLRRVPVRAPEELYFVAHGTPNHMSTSSNFPWFERVQQRLDVFEGVAAYNIRAFKVSGPDGLEQVVGQYVSGNYHALVGVPIALGRGFTAEQDRAAGSSPYAVISDRYWARRFERSRDAIGRTLTIGGQPVTIVGVTAPGFDGLAPGRPVDVTLPLSVRIQAEPDFISWTDGVTSMPLVARLKPLTSIAAARTAVDSAYREHLAALGPGGYGRDQSASLLPAARGGDRLREEYEPALALLIVLVSIVLLITCVNIANLLLVRGAARGQEIALRLSVGANRARILRQLVTESWVLALCGGALGSMLAIWATRYLTTLLQTGADPLVIAAEPNAPMFFFSVALSVLTGIAFGFAPALYATRVDLNTAIKAGGTAGSSGRQNGRKALVGVQLALSVVLLSGSVLLVRTLQNLGAVNTGIAADNILMFTLDAFDTRFPPERMAPLCADVIGRLRQRPGIVDAACSTVTPIDEGYDIYALGVPAPPPQPDAADVYVNGITPDYFRTFDIDLSRGRPFTDADTAQSPRVAIVTEAFARFYFRGDDALGRAIAFGREAVRPITIVGIASDARHDLRSPPPRMAYLPVSQVPYAPRQLTAVLRTSDGSDSLGGIVRSEVAALTRDVAVTYVRTMDQQIGASLTTERLLASLFVAFAALALLLACIGLYGVMSYDVALRTRDIGIRMALGAERGHVLAAALRQTAIITAAGLAAGLAVAAFASSFVSRFLFGLEPRDPVSLTTVAALLGVTAMLAGYVPARRASRVDPVRALRTE